MRLPSRRSKSLSVFRPSSSSLARRAPVSLRAIALRKSPQRRQKFLVVRQHYLVYVGLDPGNRLVVEVARREAISSTSSSSFSSDITRLTYPYPLRPRAVEVIADKQDLQCAAASDQPGKPGHWTAARYQAGADFKLAEHAILARGKTKIAGEDELASGSACSTADGGDAYRLCARQPRSEIEPEWQPGGTERQTHVFFGSCSTS